MTVLGLENLLAPLFDDTAQRSTALGPTGVGGEGGRVRRWAPQADAILLNEIGNCRAFDERAEHGT